MRDILLWAVAPFAVSYAIFFAGEYLDARVVALPMAIAVANVWGIQEGKYRR